MTGDLAVDANAYIAFTRDEPEVLSLIGRASTVFLPTIVLGELLFGAAKSGKAVRNRSLALGFAAKCTPLDVTPSVAARYADVRNVLRLKGQPIPENDLWIAATCLDAGIPLLTLDQHFAAVDGLELVRWTNENSTRSTTTVERAFTIKHIHAVSTTSRSNSYLECDTDCGRVAFWGDAHDSRNILKLKQVRLPATVICGCIPSNWEQHAFWVPQQSTVTILSPKPQHEQ